MSHFIASPLLASMTSKQTERWGPWLLATPRWIRADEWAHETPWALMQFSHHPRFPVVNSHIGNGQNMLVLPWVPVKHLSSVARPLTWGYLLLGSERGLAWSWWLELFSGFVSLYLVFELVLPRRPRLAVLGSLWFCTSAYVACWSVWPAHVTAFGAFAVFCAYHLVCSRKRAVILVSGAALGVTLSGFAMQLYPPWQVPLAYAFAAVLAGLLIRDRNIIDLRDRWPVRLAGSILVLVAVAVVLGSFLRDAGAALAAFVNSDYPGKRRLLGADCPAWRLFAAFYNYLTIDRPPVNSNSSESAGFFLLFPAVLVSLLVSSRLRRRFPTGGWLLLSVIVGLVVFGEFGFPEWLAELTFLSRAQGFRAQLAVGLGSIVVTMQLLAVAGHQSLRARVAMVNALVVFVSCAAVYLLLGMKFHQVTGYFGTERKLPATVTAVSLSIALVCALLVLGRARLFGATLILALVLTSGFFNPLSVGFAEPDGSELGRAVAGVLAKDAQRDGDSSLWLTYGGPDYPNPGIVAAVMGARVFSGVYEYPQLDLWRTLDPTGAERSKYNRYALVKLEQAPLGSREITFIQPHYLLLSVRAAPDHPAFRAMGARYALTFGDSEQLRDPPIKMIYQASDLSFKIWRLTD
ncbi:MAG: hypothetical protein ABIS92_06360 [Polyangia bacterium]